MKRLLDIQTCGSLAVVGAFTASELAARLLDAHPGSRLAWYLNAGLFRSFEQARVDALATNLLFGPASLPIAVLLLVAILLARATQFRFAVALFANLSFVGAVMLSYSAIFGSAKHQTASLTVVELAQSSDLLLVFTLVVTSFTAFAVSHWTFATAIRATSSAERHPA